MERDATDELIDFYAKADIQNSTLALALLEPLKILKAEPLVSEATSQPEEPTPNEPYISELTKHEDKIQNAFGPIKSITEELWNLGLQTQAEEVTAKTEELKQLIIKSFEDINEKTSELEYVETIDSNPCGDEAFLRDHNLLSKLIIHPNMTLAKILKVYPNLPYPKYFNKNAKVNKLLGEWLPFVSKYSKEYLIGTPVEPDVHELVVSILKMITDKNPKKKRKKTKDNTVRSLDIVKDCSSKN